MAAHETKRGGGGPYNRAMSEFILRHMTGADLPGVLAVQAQCYGDALLESVAALESRLTLSPDTCWFATRADGVPMAYLLTHAWPAAGLPALDGRLVRDWGADEPLVWFIHDLAVAPAGRGTGVAARLYAAAHAAARKLALTRSRLIAVQAAAPWWCRLGYAPVVAQAQYATKLAAYGEAAVMMERCLADARDRRQD